MANKDYIDEQGAWKNKEVCFFLDTQKQQGLERDTLELHRNNVKNIVNLFHSKELVEFYAKKFSLLWGRTESHFGMAETVRKIISKFPDSDMVKPSCLIAGSNCGTDVGHTINNIYQHMIDLDLMSKDELKAAMNFVSEIKEFKRPPMEIEAGDRKMTIQDQSGYSTVLNLYLILMRFERADDWKGIRDIFLRVDNIRDTYGDETIVNIIRVVYFKEMRSESLDENQRIAVFKLFSDEFVKLSQLYGKLNLTDIRDAYIKPKDEAARKRFMRLANEKKIVDIAKSIEWSSSFIKALPFASRFLDDKQYKRLKDRIRKLDHRTIEAYIIFLASQDEKSNFDFWIKRLENWHPDHIYSVGHLAKYGRIERRGMENLKDNVSKHPVGTLIDASNKTKEKSLIIRTSKIIEDLVMYFALSDMFDEFKDVKDLNELSSRLLLLKYCIKRTDLYAALLKSRHSFNKVVKDSFEELFGHRPSVSMDNDVIDYLKLIQDFDFLEPNHKKNVQYLCRIQKEYGSIYNYFKKQHADVLSNMEANLKNVKLYVGGGKLKLSSDASAVTQDWKMLTEGLIMDLLGSKSLNRAPTLQIKDLSTKKIYQHINKYISAIKEGDEEATKHMLEAIEQLLEEANKKCEGERERMDLELISDRIQLIRGAIQYKTIAGTLTVNVCRRRVPRDMYDSEILACCVFLPGGSMKEEIAPLLADPRTTLLDFEVGNIKVATVMIVAGIGLDGKSTLLVDTTEGGAGYYALPGKKMHKFILDSLLELSKKCGFKNILFYDCGHGRPQEFVRYVKDTHKLKSEKLYFDAEFFGEDSKILTFSHINKHHYTDAFGRNALMKGKFKGYQLKVK
ncbi:hypothetical protein ACFLQI_00605 [Candidatus Undinarchaeota archaeon]